MPKVEKLLVNKLLLKLLLSILLLSQKMLKRQNINNLINDNNNSIDNHSQFMEQAFNKPYPSRECKCTTTKEIELIIKSLTTKNSYGYDKISTKILKISCPFISSPLNYVCNKILFWGVFPDILKYALIKPLHENGDRCEVSNYRPVSLLITFSKIFEIVMQTRILKHLTKFNILCSEQYNLRISLETDRAIYTLTT